MPRLSALFEHMRSNRAAYMGATKGGDFEDRVALHLDTVGGFNRVEKEDIPAGEFRRIKKQAQAKISAGELRNPSGLRGHYVKQPFGTQAYPDFMVIMGASIVGIETKFSTKKQASPVWNSGLPRAHGLYVFASRGRGDLTYFKGADVIGEDEVMAMHAFFDDLKRKQNEFNSSRLADQRYGFAVYVRNAFEQKKTPNPNALTNFFENPHREELEQSVIDYLRRMEDEQTWRGEG